MGYLKNFYKKNTHNGFFKAFASMGRGLNRLYENRNHNMQSNGELQVIKMIAEFDPQVIIDGGANVGKYSEQLSKYATTSKIYAFEPVNNTFEELKLRMTNEDNIVCVNLGLFSENCTKKINLFASNAHSSLYDQDDSQGHTVNVELVKGDDFVEENNIEYVDFLKLDLEGAEYDAIKGFEKCFKKGNIKAVQFEYGQINILARKLLIDFYEFFESRGYAVGKIYPKGVDFRGYLPRHEDFIGPNFIAVLKKETELINALSLK